MKLKVKQLLNSIATFVQSDLLIALNALLILIGWSFDIWVIMLPVVLFFNILPLFFTDKTRHLLSILMMFPLVISASRHQLSAYSPMLVAVIALFAGMIFNLIFFKRSFKPLGLGRIKGFHLSLIALIIPVAFAGVTLPANNAIARVAALALVMAFAAGYCFMVITNQEEDQRRSLMEYVLKVLMVMGFVILAEMVIYFARLNDFSVVLDHVVLKKIALGWAGPNNVAPTLSMCIPATLYFCIRKNKVTPLYAAIAIFEYGALFLTGCRGAILFTTLAMPPMLLYVAIKSQNKLAFVLTVSAVFAVGVFVTAYYGETVSTVITHILHKGLESSGRTDILYPEAIEAFKRSPIFGSGWDHRLGELAEDGYSPYWYHSTALQIMATMGVAGIIAFAFFYFFRYRTYIELRRTPAALALLCATLLFDLYGMIDTNFFGPTFFLLLLCLTFATEMSLPEDKCRAFGSHNPATELVAAIRHMRLLIIEKRRSKKNFVGYSREDEADAPIAPASPETPDDASTE